MDTPHAETRSLVSCTTNQLLSWGAEVNLKALEKAYFRSKVFGREAYEAIRRSLSTFTEHLATIRNSAEYASSQTGEPAFVGDAMRYVKDRFQKKTILNEASRAVNASTRHFCKVINEVTGLMFTDYLARVWVEKAKNLLQNPHLRVSEVVFENGFEPISQFNRFFKRIIGLAPTRFRMSKQKRHHVSNASSIKAAAFQIQPEIQALQNLFRIEEVLP